MAALEVSLHNANGIEVIRVPIPLDDFSFCYRSLSAVITFPAYTGPGTNVWTYVLHSDCGLYPEICGISHMLTHSLFLVEGTSVRLNLGMALSNE